MTKFYTKDYDLRIEQLDDKYNPDGDGQHPGYTKHGWREAVKCLQTEASYWEWVHFRLQCEMEDLAKDNPYTHSADPGVY